MFDQMPMGWQPVPGDGAARREHLRWQRSPPPPQRGVEADDGNGNHQQIEDLTELIPTETKEQAELAVISTWEVSVVASIASSALGASRQYNEDVQVLHQRAMNDGEDVDASSSDGLPVRVWAETCAYLGKKLEEGANTTVTEYHCDVIMKQEDAQIATFIPVFIVKCNKGKDDNGGREKCRFQCKFGFNGHQQTILTNQLKTEGEVRRLGSALRVALERELDRWENN